MFDIQYDFCVLRRNEPSLQTDGPPPGGLSLFGIFFVCGKGYGTNFLYDLSHTIQNR